VPAFLIWLVIGVVFLLVVGVLAASYGDGVVGGKGSMKAADDEARARSAGIDHMAPPHG